MKTKTTENILNDCNEFLEMPPKREGTSIVFPNPFNFLQEKWVRVDVNKNGIPMIRLKPNDKIILIADENNMLIECHESKSLKSVLMTRTDADSKDELSQSTTSNDATPRDKKSELSLATDVEGVVKLSSPDKESKGDTESELSNSADVKSGRDTLIHYWKRDVKEIVTVCGLRCDIPMVSLWSLVSCPECLKYRKVK